MAEKIKRSIQSFIAGKTEVAHSCKDRIPLVYWYFVKRICGGWTEFDVRDIEKACGVPIEVELIALNDSLRLKTVAEYCEKVGIQAIIDRQIANAIAARIRA